MSQTAYEQEGQEKTETVFGYVFNVVFSMLFPIVALWYGPKYLLTGAYVKGVLLIVIVAVEVIVVWSMISA